MGVGLGLGLTLIGNTPLFWMPHLPGPSLLLRSIRTYPPSPHSLPHEFLIFQKRFLPLVP